jgi:hypothetical protein
MKLPSPTIRDKPDRDESSMRRMEGANEWEKRESTKIGKFDNILTFFFQQNVFGSVDCKTHKEGLRITGRKKKGAKGKTHFRSL